MRRTVRAPRKRSVTTVIAALVLSCVAGLVHLVPSWAAGYTRGVDVSHYQGTIDWKKVAANGHLFAYQKATEGTTFTDPTYASNRKHAAANGVLFGAYHFARPEGSTAGAARADAMQEADYFVQVAAPAAGDLVPALDLEGSQAMPTKRLIKWVDAWLNEVRTRIGASPVIYTSPYFWSSKFGDTTHFADEGYKLWLARWTSAASPGVPAQNWGGNGWTFWQWTDCAKVPGIQGCVDEDRYRGSDFTSVTIPGAIPTPTPTPTVTYVRPTNTSPPTISGDATVGSTLTATNGTWEGSEPLAYAYGWFRCDSAGAGCTGIADGTGPTYQLTPDDFGHTMEVVVTATNGGGSSSATSAPTSTVSDSTPPAQPSVSSLARVTTSSDVELAWTDGDEGARTFDVRERVADFNSGFGSFSDVVTETSSSSSTFAVAPGHTYCFSARAHDEADNASDWSSESCTTTPVDDRNLTSSTGWLRLRSSASYLGTYSAAKQRGAKLSLKGIRATRLALVAQRCSGCGRVRIYLGGKVLKDIRLDAATKKNRAIIPIIGFDSVTRGKVTIEIRSSGRPVRIDGLAVQGG